MLSRIRHVPQTLSRIIKSMTMPIATGSSSRSQSPQPSSVKRQKLAHEEQPVASLAHGAEGAGLSEAELVEREMSLPVEHVKTYDHELDYRNKLVLAPMVRTGSCKSYR